MNEAITGFPARLHILLASKAPLGLVIRRGPSKTVATLLWDRRNDTFKLGQWMKGRIYERRSDLSPDGKHLIYFAMNGKWSGEAKGAWTAISHAPYLRATNLFPKGDCWNGGGLWTGAKSYWLNDGYGHGLLRSTSDVQRDEKFERPQLGNNEDLGVYFPRLIRDGWQMIADHNPAAKAARVVFEKPLAKGWTLRKIAHAGGGRSAGKGVYWDEHQLIKNDIEIDCPDWEWADIDVNRLVWATKGKLFCGDLNKQGITGEAELYDFNQMTFEALEAPY